MRSFVVSIVLLFFQFNPAFGETFATVFQKHGFDHLSQRVSIEELIDVLRVARLPMGRGKFSPQFNKTPKLDSFYSGHSTVSPEMKYLGSWTYFSFDLELLNCWPFWISGKDGTEWQNAIIVASHNTGLPSELDDWLEKRSLEIGEVFLRDVPMRYLKAIWVHELKRDETLRKLHDAGIDRINGAPIEDLVQSPELDPRDEHLQDHVGTYAIRTTPRKRLRTVKLCQQFYSDPIEGFRSVFCPRERSSEWTDL